MFQVGDQVLLLRTNLNTEYNYVYPYTVYVVRDTRGDVMTLNSFEGDQVFNGRDHTYAQEDFVLASKVGFSVKEDRIWLLEPKDSLGSNVFDLINYFDVPMGGIF